MYAPYVNVGQKLRRLREQAKESLFEVSGAVEIDTKVLERIEAGQELPSADILALLMTHFNVAEPEADRLWEMAGYTPKNSQTEQIIDEQMLKQIIMVLPFDNRVVYTDVVNVEAQPKGVVLNFGLSAGNVQPQTVSRLGMSVEQAKHLIVQLQAGLQQMGQPRVRRALPEPKNSKKTPKSKKKPE